MDRMKEELPFLPAVVVTQQSLKGLPLVVAFGQGNRLVQEEGHRIQVAPVQSADAVHLRDDLAVAQEELHVEPDLPFRIQRLEHLRRDARVVQGHRARGEDVLAVLLVRLDRLVLPLEDVGAQARELGVDVLAMPQLQVSALAGRVPRRGGEHLGGQQPRHELPVMVVIVLAVVDPDVLQVVMNGRSDAGTEPPGVHVDRLEHLLDLEGATVTLRREDSIAGDRRPVQVVRQSLLPARELLEPWRVNAQHQIVHAVRAEPLQLAGSLALRPAGLRDGVYSLRPRHGADLRIPRARHGEPEHQKRRQPASSPRHRAAR